MDQVEDPLLLIDPTKREAVRERIRVVEEYLSRPSEDAVIVGSRKLGVSIASFYRIARAWKATRDPRRLGIISRRATRREDVEPLNDAQEAVLREAVAMLPSNASTDKVTDRARELGKTRSIAMPPPRKIRPLVEGIRDRPAAPEEHPSGRGFLVVEHVAIDLGVLMPGRSEAIRPVAVFLADADTGNVVDFVLDEGPPNPAAVAALLASALRRGAVTASEDVPEGTVRPIMIDRFPGHDWSPLLRILERAGCRVVGKLRATAFESWLHRRHGGRIAELTLRPRITSRPPSQRIWHRSDKRETPVGAAEAERIILARLAYAQNRQDGPISIARAIPSALISTLAHLH